MIFDLNPIWGLLPLILYVVLSFIDKLHPIFNVVVCVIISAVLTKQDFSSFGGIVSDSLGSFLGMIGFIIMLGSGLGAILQKTGVAEYIVRSLTNKINIKSTARAVIAIMLCSTLLVSLLGTLAGANAILAPIIIPLVAAIGITPSTVATVFMGAGLTGMFLGPYTPQVVTIMELTGLDYGTYLLSAGLPLGVLVLALTYVFATHIQKKTFGIYAYETVHSTSDYAVRKETQAATCAFAICMVTLICYGIFLQGGSSYSIVVIIVTAVVTGLIGKLGVSGLIDTFVHGAAKMMWLFIMFILFNPLITFIAEAGSFEKLVEYLEPLLASQHKPVFALVATLTGIFGIGGAATADNVVLDSMFKGIINQLGITPSLWALILLVSGQITSFAYPEADMMGQLGLARSKDVKNLVKFGITVTVCATFLVIVRSVFD